jgi:hypothetical protein
VVLDRARKFLARSSLRGFCGLSFLVEIRREFRRGPFTFLQRYLVVRKRFFEALNLLAIFLDSSGELLCVGSLRFEFGAEFRILLVTDSNFVESLHPVGPEFANLLREFGDLFEQIRVTGTRLLALWFGFLLDCSLGY